MMELLSYITLQFDGQQIAYKLYFNPSDRKYYFRPDAVITLYPSYVVARSENSWIVEGGVSAGVQQQLLSNLAMVRKKKDGPLL
ncbi:MAG: hypothetical protein EOO15_00965 [Chitinophagaceae bacterium]|nr:MAG: hypothetical protein EOO15_00965 [Chitinophagaceae bacterium]